MKKIILLTFAVLLAPLATAQTFQYSAGAPILAGQCVGIAQISGGDWAVPCDNTGGNYASGVTPAVGVALNSTGPVLCRSGATPPCPPVNPPLVTVQYAGIVTVPNNSSYSLTNGAFIGDFDGTGDLNSLGFELCTCNGPMSYAGIFIGYVNAQQTLIKILVQPGYVPMGGSDPSAAISNARRVKK